MDSFKDVYMDTVIFESYGGKNISEVMSEVYFWFLKHPDEKTKCVLPHINGIKITFEKNRS